MQRSQILVHNRVFAYPTCIRRPRYEGSRRNVAIPFGMEKLEWLGYRWWKNFEDVFIRFDATHERDGHTDRHTHTHTHRITA